MAQLVKLIEAAEWVEDLHALQDGQALQGGAPDLAENAGLANLHAAQLGARTLLLRAGIDAPLAEVGLSIAAGGFVWSVEGNLHRNASGGSVTLTGTHGAGLIAAGLTATGLGSTALAAAGRMDLARVYPHVETADHRLAITDNGGGSLSLDAGQTWVWRGGRRMSSDALLTRSVSTAANRIYHLVWSAPGVGPAADVAAFPNGRVDLFERTSGTDLQAQFDSGFDQMLIARVVTNGANVPTITALANAANLELAATVNFQDQAHEDNIAPEGLTGGVYTVLNWARRPKVALVGATDITTSAGGDTFNGNSAIEINVAVNAAHRYGVRSVYSRTQNGAGGDVRWQAWA